MQRREQSGCLTILTWQQSPDVRRQPGDDRLGHAADV